MEFTVSELLCHRVLFTADTHTNIAAAADFGDTVFE